MPQAPSVVDLDEIDRRILTVLQEDGRITLTDLA
ncbi:AsnC family transcriptional regulator, partial [Vibrio parahaemolyticus]